VTKLSTARKTPASPAATPPGPEVPRHVAVIMDGNGRWARNQGLARITGHEKGADAVRATLEGCSEAGVQYLTLYAFSTENWKRPKSETSALMGLLERFLNKEHDQLVEREIRLKTIGTITDLPASTQKELRRAVRDTAKNRRLTLILALSYSSRMEIVEAARSLAAEVSAGRLTPDQIDEATFARHLATAEYPDPDLLIRTSGEQRLSNFLLWQLSYTELYITPKLWPDFSKDDLHDALREYGRRQRRFGAVDLPSAPRS